MDTKYSVLMSVYINENPIYFNLSIKSMIRQTLFPDEIIIVKDGPISFELNEVIDGYIREYPQIFTILEFKENLGLAKALNEGLRLSRNEIIARMDTDDISVETRLEEQVIFLNNNPKVDIVGSYSFQIDEDGNVVKSKELPVLHEEIEKLIWSNPIIHPTVVFRKNRIFDIGGYDETIKRRQDYELWFRAIYNGLIFENIPNPLLYYRVTSNYFVKNNMKKQIEQFKIGYKGCRLVGASTIAYLGLLAPIIRGLVPSILRKPVLKLFGKMDPRNKRRKVC